MIQKCKFDKNRDIQETIPNLSIDLEKAVENHVVKDTGIMPEFNMIQDSDEVGAIIRDNFQAIDSRRAIEASIAASQQQSQPTPTE